MVNQSIRIECTVVYSFCSRVAIQDSIFDIYINLYIFVILIPLFVGNNSNAHRFIGPLAVVSIYNIEHEWYIESPGDGV